MIGSALNLCCWDFSPEYRSLAWTASLVLVVLVLSINLLAQYLTRGSQKHKR